MTAIRCRVLVAMFPRVLEDTLAVLLRSVDLDDVFTRTDEPQDMFGGRYDAVITNLGTDDVEYSPVVIQLPDEYEQGRTAIIREGNTTHLVDVEDVSDVLRLLDRVCPVGELRAARFARR